jgi:hypothetical protein
MKTNRPKEWDAAVAFDDQLRAEFQFRGVEGLPTSIENVFPSRKSTFRKTS